MSCLNLNRTLIGGVLDIEVSQACVISATCEVAVVISERERVYPSLAHTIGSENIFVFDFNQLYFAWAFTYYDDVAVLSELQSWDSFIELVDLVGWFDLIEIDFVLGLWLLARVQINSSWNTDSQHIVWWEVERVDLHLRIVLLTQQGQEFLPIARLLTLFVSLGMMSIRS